jgi:chromosome segregation ATPase
MQKDRDELQNVRDRFSQVAELEREAEDAQRRITDRREGLDRVYTESDFELNRLLNNFEEVMKDKQTELSAIKREIDGCIDEMKRLREKNDRLLVTKGMAESLAKQFDDQVARYNDYGEKISRKFDITFTRNANKEDFSQSAASGYSQAASSGISQRTGTYYVILLFLYSSL